MVEPVRTGEDTLRLPVAGNACVCKTSREVGKGGITEPPGSDAEGETKPTKGNRGFIVPMLPIGSGEDGVPKPPDDGGGVAVPKPPTGDGEERVPKPPTGGGEERVPRPPTDGGEERVPRPPNDGGE